MTIAQTPAEALARDLDLADHRSCVVGLGAAPYMGWDSLHPYQQEKLVRMAQHLLDMGWEKDPSKMVTYVFSNERLEHT